MNEQIKEETKAAHLELEKYVTGEIKGIKNNYDYARFLSYFYVYFSALEKPISKFIPESFSNYIAERRNSEALIADLHNLEIAPIEFPKISLPPINKANHALGALYVLEGSVMGGPYIIKLLQNRGINKGFTFFKGYGEDTQSRWNNFIELLNSQVNEEKDIQEVIASANATFNHFLKTFQNK